MDGLTTRVILCRDEPNGARMLLPMPISVGGIPMPISVRIIIIGTVPTSAGAISGLACAITRPWRPDSFFKARNQRRDAYQ